jgi:hypothetical protein
MADVSLDFLASQLERVLNRLGAVEDQITVLTGMTIRLDGAVNGLATECAVLSSPSIESSITSAK